MQSRATGFLSLPRFMTGATAWMRRGWARRRRFFWILGENAPMSRIAAMSPEFIGLQQDHRTAFPFDGSITLQAGESAVDRLVGEADLRGH